jgi:cobyrinic acid a,c-diamide synthase
MKAHEFHYATILKAVGKPLFKTTDADGVKLPDMGLENGAVSGSFAHIIAPV